MTRRSVGIFGMGRMGRLHARVLGEMPDDYALVGYCDPREGETLALPALDPRTLIERADVVIVSSPAATHVAVARAALARGRTVLVEKPLSNTAASARALVDEAASGRLFVGHSERFNPVVRALAARLHALFEEGEVLRELSIERVVNGARHHHAERGGGAPAVDDVLVNLGVHDFDLVEYLTGRRAVVLGAEGDVFSSRLHLSLGAAFVTMRCAREGEPTRRVRVVTDNFTFEGDLLAHRLVGTDRRAGRETIVPLLLEEPLRAQAQALHRAARGESGGALAPGAAGLRAVELAELAITMRERRSRAISAASAAI